MVSQGFAVKINLDITQKYKSSVTHSPYMQKIPTLKPGEPTNPALGDTSSHSPSASPKPGLNGRVLSGGASSLKFLPKHPFMDPFAVENPRETREQPKVPFLHVQETTSLVIFIQHYTTKKNMQESKVLCYMRI